MSGDPFPFPGNPATRASRSDLLTALATELHLWLLDPDGAGDDVYAWCERMLSADENERRKKFLRTADERSFLLAHGLLRAVLSRYGELAAARWRFTAGQYGRPEIANPDAPAGLRFNLSHTCNRIVVLVHSSADAGVDVERVGRVRNPTALSRRFFTAEEHESVLSLPEEARDAYFVRLWTLKEAYVKARGLSLALNAQNLWFEARDPAEIRVHFSAGFGDDPSSWTFTASTWGDRHLLATAARSSTDGCERRVRRYTA